MGMTQDVMCHLFEPFFTTKRPGEGTGLGLATVYGVVKQSGGSIRVSSELGEGTAFAIYFPRIDPGFDLPPEPEAAPASLRGTETVLVVEDQEQLRRMAGYVLRSYGYRVLEAANPWEALLYAERYASLIHLLLTDIVMPGMAGPELAIRIKPLRPSMEVIFMSGYPGRITADREIPGLAASYLPKPFSPEELATKVREVLGAPRSAGTVLVVDDEPGIRNLLRKVLTGVGYRVLEAENGRQAIQRVMGSDVDLVITDLVMPEQEGIETIQIMRRALPKLKIIAMSGRFTGSLLRVANFLGAQASLAKPIEPDELLDAVARVMAG
jgi:CheY-like chemotaxis protein